MRTLRFFPFVAFLNYIFFRWKSQCFPQSLCFRPQNMVQFFYGYPLHALPVPLRSRQRTPKRARAEAETMRASPNTGLHPYEEPCISVGKGSGTLFFAGCALRCAFCQNYEISHRSAGKETDAKGARGHLPRAGRDGGRKHQPRDGLPLYPPAAGGLPPVPAEDPRRVQHPFLRKRGGIAGDRPLYRRVPARPQIFQPAHRAAIHGAGGLL